MDLVRDTIHLVRLVMLVTTMAITSAIIRLITGARNGNVIHTGTISDIDRAGK